MTVVGVTGGACAGSDVGNVVMEELEHIIGRERRKPLLLVVCLC